MHHKLFYMGIVDRKEREKEEKRKLIINTAKKLFSEQGFEKVSLRNIADAIEYSPTMIYLYFKDKNELLHALHIEGFKMFQQCFEESGKGIVDPWKRLEELGKVYIRFALENPDYYELMFIAGGPMQTEITEDAWNEGLKSHSYLESVIRECMEAGYLNGQDYRMVAFIIWCFVHGMVSLMIKERLKMYDEQERVYLLENAHKLVLDFLAKL